MTTPSALSPLLTRTPQAFTSASTRASNDAYATLANRLAEKLGLPADALNGPKDNFSPSKVAERVLGFIDQRLSQEAASGADSARLEKLMSQAREGVEKGFSEARKILDGMGALTGTVAKDIDDTYARIQDGLSALDKRYLPQSSTPTQLSAAASRSFSAQAQTFELDVITRDGDRLRVSMAQASAGWSSSSAAVVEQGGVRASTSSGQSSNIQIGAWQVSVEGELDAGEIDALEKLFSQVQQLSDDFYSGDVKGAFDRALALDFGSEHLSSMALKLTQTSVRQVTQSYGSVSGQAVSAITPDLQDYVQKLLDTLQRANDLVERPDSVLESLLGGVMSLDARFDQAQITKAQGLNHTLLQDLFGSLPAKETKGETQ